MAQFAPLLVALDHELARPVLDGEATGTLALAGADGEWRPNAEPVKTFVAEADRVDYVRDRRRVGPAGASVRVLPTAEVPTRSVHTEDPSRRLFEVDTASPAATRSRSTPTRSARCSSGRPSRWPPTPSGPPGGCSRWRSQYAKERYQFDVPIGSFQAIQHKLADVSLAVERARSAVQYAAMTVDAGDAERHRAVHVAKAAAGSAATKAAKESIQIHGGIGYTWEHDLHLYLRRAFGSEHWMGGTDWHHDRLADLLI